MSNEVLVPVNTITPNAGWARMRPEAAWRFNKLREQVFKESGVDFLAICGDVLRPASFISNKDGVATRSWHKTGRAFDYDQTSIALVLVSEILNGKQYFRTYLRCSRQDGSLGEKRKVKDMRGYTVDAYLFDFTGAAEALEFRRIPAWNGWQQHYNRREFWHYQFDEGLTWDAAMLQLRGKSRPAIDAVIGLNDRGEQVRVVQNKLAELGFLSKSEIDGIFGAKSKVAVEKFQAANNLDADGIVGAKTREKLF